MQAWAHYLWPGRAQWGHFMPKNISAETTQTALFFSCVSKAQPQACALQSMVCLLERIQVWNKSVDSLAHIRSARFFLGKNTTGGWRGKKICQEKWRRGDIFSRRFSKTRWTRGQRLFCCLKSVKWMLVQITGLCGRMVFRLANYTFQFETSAKKKASRASALRHGLKVVMDGASDVTASRSRARRCVSVQTLQHWKPQWRCISGRKYTMMSRVGGGGRQKPP